MSAETIPGEMTARVADVAEAYDALGGMITMGAFMQGIMIGIKLGHEHADEALNVISDFFAIPHTERETAGFYVHYDYIAEGKDPE